MKVKPGKHTIRIASHWYSLDEIMPEGCFEAYSAPSKTWVLRKQNIFRRIMNWIKGK